MEARLLGVTFLVALVVAIGPHLGAQVPGICDVRPDDVGCQGGGSGGGPGDPGDPDPEPEGTYYWGPWTTIGTCIDENPQILRYLLWVDGGYVRPWELSSVPPGSVLGVDRVFQLVCTDLPDDDLWDELVRAIEALPPPIWETSPEEPGVTGLDTWLWHSGTTIAGPVTATWTHPPSGRSYVLEGRAWVGSLTWATGDGAVVVAGAPTHVDGSVVGGSEADPAATHRYETSSANAGLEDGYPVALTVRWVGEWRWDDGSGWTAWQPMVSTLDVATSGTFEVVQIVGDLSP